MIKVCGMRDAENIREVENLGVDWIGLIFWPKTKRYVSTKPAYLPETAKRVGVFVDASTEDILWHVEAFGLDLIQLHGKESPEFTRECSMLCNPCNIIKAFSIGTAEDLNQTKAYEGIADYFLFDTKGKAVGGNGEKFDWSVLSGYEGATPFILSGGIGPQDYERVRLFQHPKCVGIDLNSRFETEPGYKDVNKLREFIKQIKYEQNQSSFCDSAR